MGGAPHELDRRRGGPEAVLDHLADYDDVVLPTANGAPQTVLDELEAAAHGLDPVRVHQLFPIVGRAYHGPEHDALRHVSWFLSGHDRDAFHAGHCDLVPNNFSDVPMLMRRTLGRTVVCASTAPPDEHG